VYLSVAEGIEEKFCLEFLSFIFRYGIRYMYAYFYCGTNSTY